MPPRRSGASTGRARSASGRRRSRPGAARRSGSRCPTTGRGSSRRSVGRLFMPFVTTKAPGAGTGLGLSVSFGIVAGHGGTLRYERDRGAGATFSHRAPLRPDPGRRAAGATEPPRRARPTSSMRGPGRRPRSRRSRGGRRLRSRPAAAAPRPRARRRGGDPRAPRRVLARHGFEPVLAETGELALEIDPGGSARRDPVRPPDGRDDRDRVHAAVVVDTSPEARQALRLHVRATSSTRSCAHSPRATASAPRQAVRRVALDRSWRHRRAGPEAASALQDDTGPA